MKKSQLLEINKELKSGKYIEMVSDVDGASSILTYIANNGYCYHHDSLKNFGTLEKLINYEKSQYDGKVNFNFFVLEIIKKIN